MSNDIAMTAVSFGLNLLGAVVVVAFKHYLSSRPAAEVGAAAVGVVMLAFVGFALGAASVLLRGPLADARIPFGTAGAEAVLVLTCLGLALTRLRSRAGLLSYQLEVLALWAPFIAAWLWFNDIEGYARNFFPIAAGLYVACAAVGGMLTLMFRSRS